MAEIQGTVAGTQSGANGRYSLVVNSDGSINVGTGGGTPAPSGTATLANVPGSSSSVTLIPANAARKGFVIVNDSTAVLYVKFGSAASTTSYSYYLPGSSSGAPFTLEGAPYNYSGIITGIWASATGAARTTELTA